MQQPVTTPEWVKDAIFYQIWPDSFARSERVPKPRNLQPWDASPTLLGFKGGDLLGVVEHLDYLEDLGVTAIYFTPVFQSTANHRYHTYDYYKVDPILGGDAALRELVDAAHARNIRVVLDGVFNHASRGFFQFSHILENGAASPYADWFQIHGYPMRAYEPGHQYKGWANLAALPVFNHANPEAREFLWGVARYWIDFGIDGWRLDVPNEVDDDAFWQEFRRRVKAGNPDAYIVGEIWTDARRWLQGDQFDAVMNYLFTRACASFFIRDFDHSITSNTGPLRISRVRVPRFAQMIDQLLRLYPPEITAVQLNLLDSHDMPRFLSLARGDTSALKLATLFQMTYPGAPSIYYGDEIGLGTAVPPGQRPRYDTATDPDTRRAFPWDESQWDHDLRNFFKHCIALRKAHPALRRGEYSALAGGSGLYIYRRTLGDDSLVIALNTNTAPANVDFPVGQHTRELPDGTRLKNLWSGSMAEVRDGRIVGWQIPARSGVIWQVLGAEPDAGQQEQRGG